MAPWASGQHWMKRIPKPASSAAGCTRPPISSTNCPNPSRVRRRRHSRKSGWPRAGRPQRKPWRSLCATTRRSIPRPWPSWKRIEPSCWLSMIIRPNIGDTSAPPMPLSRPLPLCATGRRAQKIVYRATASLDWASRCCSRQKSAGSLFSIRRKYAICLRG
uniref:Uncharacterized protein n=1 Tax=Acidithiobacillus ferrooxidans TaxID=920 RepID=Q5PU84_ACIFR|nr:unknown [Acidithiobacillus ferrooxidans]